LGKARAHWRLKQIPQAEASYLNALATPAVSNFQNAAYMELLSLYTRTKQGIKIGPMIMRASKDKHLTAKQRQVFINALAEIQKRMNSKMQEK
jgi:TRAP-type C4-dicarboxylate transport system substrate-binding protein